jgi:hypothetical protein
MDRLHHFIMTTLDPIGVVIGLLLAIPVVWTWYDVVIGRRRRARRWLQQVRRDPGGRPALLLVDLLADKEVLPQMERHIAGRPELAAIPADRRFTLQRQRRLTPDDLTELSADIRARAADIARAGCDTVHCLYAGPAAAAALIGAEFANGARCLIYQHHQGRYENWGPIRHGGD